MKRLPVISISLFFTVWMAFGSDIAFGEVLSSQTLITQRIEGDEMVKGEVLKVDAEMSQIVIKHRELVRLGMPAMTMLFSVPYRSMLEGVVPGEVVRFSAQIVPRGLMINKMEILNN